MADHSFVDLVVARERDTGAKYVVQCPSWEMKPGDMVEFESRSGINIGEVIGNITIDKESDAWKFIDSLSGITQYVRFWKSGGKHDS